MKIASYAFFNRFSFTTDNSVLVAATILLLVLLFI